MPRAKRFARAASDDLLPVQARPALKKTRGAGVSFSEITTPSQTRPAALFIGALIAGISNRMLAGASNHHRARWNIGMAEWRALIALGGNEEMIVREVSERADLDYAQTSKALKTLSERGYVTLVQTRTRGRATLVALSASGKALHREVMEVARVRQERLLAGFTPAEAQTLRLLLERLEARIGYMNAEAPDTQPPRSARRPAGSR